MGLKLQRMKHPGGKMTETDRTYEYDAFLLGGFELEPLEEEEQANGSTAVEKPLSLPVNYSLDVIQRLIERLQEL
jgi:hypothetical protein